MTICTVLEMSTQLEYVSTISMKSPKRRAARLIRLCVESTEMPGRGGMRPLDIGIDIIIWGTMKMYDSYDKH